MGKLLSKLKIVAFVAGIVEVLLIVALALFYYLDFPSGFKNLMQPLHWLIVASVIALFNIIFVGVVMHRATLLRSRSDLQAADLIGGDIQEAYNFGQVGLVVTDESDIVIWINNLLRDRHIEILDKNILDWQGSLQDLKTGRAEMTVSLNINSHTYEVKLLPEAHLYIFKDVTEFVNLTAYERQHSMTIGLITIDNYSDLVGNSEDETSDLISNVRSEISGYAKDFGLVLRRYRYDSYLVVANYESLSKMEKDGFSILTKVRKTARGADVAPTLSIGFAHDFPNPEKLNDMAANALNIALSRGGDQAVVSQYNKELKFFGGKTEALESQSKVKIRNFADGFIGLIKQSKNVFVMGHSMADMDAIGACLGVLGICENYKINCQIIYDAKNTEKKTRQAMSRTFNKNDLDRITISPKQAFDSIDDSTLLVVVDVSVPAMTHAPKVLDKATKTVVIDHHRMGASFIEPNVMNYIEPSASSASEILAEFIHYATANPRIELKPSYATLMLSGMFLDTNFFKSKTTGIRTFDAAEVLKTYGADNSLADDFLKDEYEEYSLTTKIISTMKTPYYGIVYCVADDHDIIDRAAISKVANQLMQLRGINASFVIGRTEADTIGISCRSDSTVNVQLLAEKMNGGGHFSMAASSFKNQTVAGVESILLQTLATYLNEAKSSTPMEAE